MISIPQQGLSMQFLQRLLAERAAGAAVLSAGVRSGRWKAAEFPSKHVDVWSLQMEGALTILTHFNTKPGFWLCPFLYQINSTVDGKGWLLWENGH